MAGVAVGITAIVGLFALMLKTGEEKIEQTIARHYDAEDAQFGRAMGVLLGPTNIEGNRFEVLLNGDEIFPSMLAAIRGARKTITFESYIYWSGSIGREFAEALVERARAGVKVHVLLDWLGSSKLDAAQVAIMESAGVMVRKFHEPAWYHLARMNNRTHRGARRRRHRGVYRRRRHRRRLGGLFQQDQARSRAITLHEWRQRPLAERVIEHSAALLRLQL